MRIVHAHISMINREFIEFSDTTLERFGFARRSSSKAGDNTSTTDSDLSQAPLLESYQFVSSLPVSLQSVSSQPVSFQPKRRWYNVKWGERCEWL